MANRRMFSKQVIQEEDFLEMPSSTRLLYYDLGMNADDDGFVNPKMVMRMTGATDDDLKVLLAKKYVIAFDDRVFVIRDWKVNNEVRVDRYKETFYTEYKKLLEINDKKQYVKPSGITTGTTKGTTDGVPRLGKVRLGKDNINISEASSDELPASKKKSYKQNQFPNEWYQDVLDCYCEAKQIEPVGDEWTLLKREIKQMFVNGRTPDEICRALHYMKKAPFTWTLKTIRTKMPEIMAKLAERKK